MPAKVDYRQCIGCKICYDLCPIDVFTWDEELICLEWLTRRSAGTVGYAGWSAPSGL